jgi:hypothetical protein
MKLNPLFAHMRTATRALLTQGPAAATTAIQNLLRGAAANTAEVKTPPMRDINPPPQQPAAKSAPHDAREPARKSARPVPSDPPAQGGTDILNQLIPDLMASLDRAGNVRRAAFKMPNFEVPAFDLRDAQDHTEVLPGRFIDGSHSNAAGTRSYKL